MDRIIKTLILLLSVSTLNLSSALASETLQFERCYVDNVRPALECASFQTSDGANLHVVRAPAVKPLPESLPLFVLAGGPGQAASEMAMLISGPLSSVNQTSDVLFVDRRGTGQSNAWQCDLGDEQIDLEALQLKVKSCYEMAVWPTSQLNSKRSVDDLEEIRNALGVSKINLWGGSWGTRFALLYARWYPEAINRMVLDAVAPQSRSVLHTARAAQISLERLEQLCTLDAACAERFTGFVDKLIALTTPLDATRTIHVTDPKSGEVISEDIANWMIAQTVRGALYQPDQAAQLPYVINEAAEGRWQPLAVMMNESSAMASSMYLGLTFSVLCAEELPRSSDELAVVDARGSFLGNSWYDFWSVACDVWPVESASYPELSMLDHPTLLLSGLLDPITPPSYAEESMQYLSNAQHIVFEHGSHINSTQPCMAEVLDVFYRGEALPIETSCGENSAFPKFQVDRFGPSLGTSVPEVSDD